MVKLEKAVAMLLTASSSSDVSKEILNLCLKPCVRGDFGVMILDERLERLFGL